MAKLNPKDPQFGIPVASRIDSDIAQRLNKEAEKAGKTFSRHLSDYISMASHNERKIKGLEVTLKEREETIEELEAEIDTLQETMSEELIMRKRAIGKFIVEMAEGDSELATQLINNYNKILKNEQSK